MEEEYLLLPNGEQLEASLAVEEDDDEEENESEYFLFDLWLLWSKGDCLLDDILFSNSSFTSYFAAINFILDTFTHKQFVVQLL